MHTHTLTHIHTRARARTRARMHTQACVSTNTQAYKQPLSAGKLGGCVAGNEQRNNVEDRGDAYFKPNTSFNRNKKKTE